MSQGNQSQGELRQHTVAVVATFTAMMHAHEQGDLATAADAQRRLGELGVVVRIPQPRRPRREGGDHE